MADDIRTLLYRITNQLRVVALAHETLTIALDELGSRFEELQNALDRADETPAASPEGCAHVNRIEAGTMTHPGQSICMDCNEVLN